VRSFSHGSVLLSIVSWLSSSNDVEGADAIDAKDALSFADIGQALVDVVPRLLSSACPPEQADGIFIPALVDTVLERDIMPFELYRVTYTPVHT